MEFMGEPISPASPHDDHQSTCIDVFLSKCKYTLVHARESILLGNAIGLPAAMSFSFDQLAVHGLRMDNAICSQARLFAQVYQT